MCQIFLILRGPGCCSSSTGVLHFRKARIALDAKLPMRAFMSPLCARNAVARAVRASGPQLRRWLFQFDVIVRDLSTL